jgi:hypothetical protein
MVIFQRICFFPSTCVKLAGGPANSPRFYRRNEPATPLVSELETLPGWRGHDGARSERRPGRRRRLLCEGRMRRVAAFPGRAAGPWSWSTGKLKRMSWGHVSSLAVRVAEERRKRTGRPRRKGSKQDFLPRARPARPPAALSSSASQVVRPQQKKGLRTRRVDDDGTR